MKTIDTYIQEAFRLRDDTKIKDKHHPHSYKELRKLLDEKYEENNEYMDCRDIDVYDVDESYNYYTMRGLFQGFTKVKVIDVTRWNIKKFDNLAQCFKRCRNLEQIKGLNTWKIDNGAIVDMSEMFEDCENLRDIGDISEWNISDITSMSKMFKGCRELSLSGTGDISKWQKNFNKSCATDVMFDESKIDLPEFL